jgi:hypothetical protein
VVYADLGQRGVDPELPEVGVSWKRRIASIALSVTFLTPGGLPPICLASLFRW